MVKLTDRAVSAWAEILAAGQIPAAWPRWRADGLPARFPRPKRFQDRLLRRTGPLPDKEAKVIRIRCASRGQGWATNDYRVPTVPDWCHVAWRPTALASHAASAGWRRLWAADSATNATTPPRIASGLKPTAGLR